MTGLLVPIASVIVAIIAAASAIAAQRAAAKASVTNTQVSSRTDMEKEAYERARRMDVETIERQDEELKEARAKIEKLEAEVADLKKRLSSVEHELPSHGEDQERTR